MCRDCWEEYGSPTIDTPAVRAAARAIGKVYEFSCVGGNLHVCIDDWNLYTLCEEFIAENVHLADRDQLAAERACVETLRPLSEAERASALGLHERFWGPDALPEPPDSGSDGMWSAGPTPLADILDWRRRVERGEWP